MASRTDFAAKDWEKAVNTLLNTALVVIFASPQVLGNREQEQTAFLGVLNDTYARLRLDAPANQLLLDMITDCPAIKGVIREQADALTARKPDEWRKLLTEGIKVVAAKASPAEYQQYSQLLNAIGNRVAGAAVEGRIFGLVGWQAISNEEKAVLDMLARLLNRPS